MMCVRMIVPLVPLLALVVACAGCPAGNNSDAGDDGGLVAGCQSSQECPQDFVCAGGQCVVGECLDSLESLCDSADVPADVEPFCCKRWQNCSFDYTCVPDPEAVIGGQCEVSDDCPDPGQFCSGGTCYDSVGRETCSFSFQCPPGERCDRTVFLCVPDIGGCELCGDEFPELCCEEGQLCDLETGFCLDIGDQECEDEDDCLPGRQCDPLGRCVQCLNDMDCGPGTVCNTGTGNCISDLLSCETDEDCTAPRVCSPVSSECVIPECLGDAQCQAMDPRQLCDVGTFTCYLPPAVCMETDEPNDSQDSATAVTSGYAGTLCRGNSDYMSFAIEGDRRYRATVSTPDFNIGGVEVAMIRDGEGIVDSETFATFEDEVTVSLITGVGEIGTAFLRVTGSGDQADQWPYTVTLTETNAPMTLDCTEEIAQGIEPNETAAEAWDIGEGASTFARCDDDDVDWYHLTIPAQHALDVAVEFDNESGDMAIELYEEIGGPEIDSSDGAGTDIERVEAAEGGTDYWLRVALWSSFASGIDGQAYTITVTAVPRPEVCQDDPDEPGNDDFDGAGLLPLNQTVDHLHCVPIDVDVHQIDVPANAGGSLAATFDHNQGDLRIDLYDDAQQLLDSSNRSTPALGEELIELPFSGENETYYARVRLHAGTSEVGQPYALNTTSYDASTCVASEPVSNNTPIEGQCVGNVVSVFPCVGTRHDLPFAGPSLATCESTPETAGCGTLCGANDQDWYRVGPLNNGQLLYARLEYEGQPQTPPGPSDGGVVDGGLDLDGGTPIDPDGGVEQLVGRIGLALARANPELTQATFVDYNPNILGQGLVELTLNAPTVAQPFEREYMVVVRPEGTEGFAALPYSIAIEVGQPCFPDTYETNETPATSTILRPGGTPLSPFQQDLTAPTLCGFDKDVYELFAFNGETVTATLLAGEGVTVDIGTRPPDLNDPPVPLAGGEGVVVPAPCVLNAGESCVVADADFTGPTQVYIVVTRTVVTAATIGAYELRVNVDPT